MSCARQDVSHDRNREEHYNINDRRRFRYSNAFLSMRLRMCIAEDAETFYTSGM